MKENITIAQMAKVTKLKHRKLRNWAEKGLIRRTKNPDNGYYSYDIDSITDVILVKLLRDIGLSYKTIKTFIGHSINEMPELFTKIKDSLTEKIREFNNHLEIISKQEQLFYRALNSTEEVSVCDPPFDSIVNFDMKKNCISIDTLDYMISFFDFKKNGFKDLIPCYIDKNDKNKECKNIAWRKNPDALYYHFVLADEGNGSLIRASNKVIEKLSEKYTVTFVFCKYIFSINYIRESDCVNYFDIWVEALPS